LRFLDIRFYNSPESDKFLPKSLEDPVAAATPIPFEFQLPKLRSLEIPEQYAYSTSSPVLNTDSDLMANMYIVLNCRRKLLEHAYGYYGMELKLAFSSL
jgi:hypothetical protein